eukprot:3922738-Amphidinium_carterae.1
MNFIVVGFWRVCHVDSKPENGSLSLLLESTPQKDRRRPRGGDCFGRCIQSEMKHQARGLWSEPREGSEETVVLSAGIGVLELFSVFKTQTALARGIRDRQQPLSIPVSLGLVGRAVFR